MSMEPHDGSLPDEFLARLQAVIPPSAWPAVLASFSRPRYTAFRVNSLLATVEEVHKEFAASGVPLEPVAWSPTALVVEPAFRSAVTRSELVSDGRIHVQGLSSMLAVQVLDPQPGESVLDLAAAPGGKASHIAALMENRGTLSVVEPVRRRMFVLADHLKRSGATIARTYLMDGRRVGSKVPGRFDRVLLDAPCSGEARFRADDPDTWRTWSPRKIREQSRKQRGLIRSAFEALRPEGTLVYATCSFAPEENESVVAGLLREFPSEAELVEVKLPIENVLPGRVNLDGETADERLSRACRILPNERYEGFFLAAIRRT